MKWGDLCIALATLLLGTALFFTVPNQGEQVVIEQDGKIVEVIELQQLPEDGRQITVKGNYTNVVEVRRDGARVISSDCPDHTCEQSGVLGKNTTLICCLPNRLLISMRTENKTPDVILQ